MRRGRTAGSRLVYTIHARTQRDLRRVYLITLPYISQFIYVHIQGSGGGGARETPPRRGAKLKLRRRRRELRAPLASQCALRGEHARNVHAPPEPPRVQIVLDARARSRRGGGGAAGCFPVSRGLEADAEAYLPR